MAVEQVPVDNSAVAVAELAVVEPVVELAVDMSAVVLVADMPVAVVPVLEPVVELAVASVPVELPLTRRIPVHPQLPLWCRLSAHHDLYMILSEYDHEHKFWFLG